MCVISIFEYKIQAKYLSSCSNTLYRESLGLTPLPSALQTSLYFLSSCCIAKYSQNRMCSQRALASGSVQELDQCGYCVLGKYLRSLSFVLCTGRKCTDLQWIVGAFQGIQVLPLGGCWFIQRQKTPHHSITIIMYTDASFKLYLQQSPFLTIFTYLLIINLKGNF